MITVAWAPPVLGMRGITDASATHRFWMLDDRHWIAVRSHLTGSRYVPGRPYGLADPEIQSIVVGENVIRRVDALIGHLLECVGLQQLSATLSDQRFLSRVFVDGDRFGAGDKFLVKLRITQHQTPTGQIRNDYEIMEVLQTWPGGKQIPLPLAGREC